MRRLGKKGLLLLFAPAALLLLAVARSSRFFAEVFAAYIYKGCSVILNRVTGVLPFSLAELLLAAGIPALFFLAVRLAVRLVAGRVGRSEMPRLHIIGHAVLNAACALSVALFWFVFFCGINYERIPFSEQSGLAVEESTKEELYGLCVTLGTRTREAREEAIAEGCFVEGVDGAGSLLSHMTVREMGKEAQRAMAALAEEYPVLSGPYGEPKPIFLSHLMSYTEITGIFMPFTLEANVNVDCTPYTIPATMCHELSHLRGFMREDEANYIAYLACVHSENAYVRYSGLMLALAYAGNQLYREDPDLYWQARESYGEEVLGDLRADALYWSRFADTAVSTAAGAANNAYLKANNQSDGTKSYGRMVDLLLAEYRRE